MSGFKFGILSSIARLIGDFFYLDIDKKDYLQSIQPPLLIISNHVSNFDPVFINLAFPELIRFVASDSIFRSFLHRKIFSFLDIIPITKGIPDAGTLRGIFDAKKNRRFSAIFAEGQASWDGVNLPLASGTLRLIMGLKLPILVLNIAGAFLAAGRWRKQSERGEVTIMPSGYIDSKELAAYDEKTLGEKLEGLLAHDEWDWQKRNKKLLRGKRAEYMERSLYLCPVCFSDSSLFSIGHDLVCKKCGMKVFINPYGFFESSQIDFKTMRDWNIWQKTFLIEFLRERYKENKSLLSPENCTVSYGPIRHVSAFTYKAVLSLKNDALVMTSSESSQFFMLKNIRGLNIQKNERMEFIHNNTLYRISFWNKRVSALKWVDAISTLSNRSFL
ncbi:lysophospholipid acyltransferase family protein [Spirochaetia bacterium 38H-sp]|uniref:Lysophospholipid acyltransferase family protein n=1 Tax=Rarispira pelagica TaxID=3141764 RepID=A0ABU9U9B7_9SPIR